MVCKNCGKELNENQKFCDNCGFKTSGENVTVCRSCGKELNASQRFCDNCGAPTSEAPQTQQAGGAYRPESTYVNSQAQVNDDGSSVMFFLLGLFIPLAGIICFAVMYNKTPKRAKSAISGMVIRYLLIIALVVGIYYFSYVAVMDGVNYFSSNTTQETEYVMNVGTYIQSEDLKITYTYCNDNAKDLVGYSPESGYKVVRADFKIENISNEDESVILTFSCYADGVACNENYCGKDRCPVAESLSAGEKATAVYYYTVPDTASDIEIETANFVTQSVIFVVE